MWQHYHNDYNAYCLEFTNIEYTLCTNQAQIYSYHTDYLDKTIQKKDYKITRIKLSINEVTTMMGIPSCMSMQDKKEAKQNHAHLPDHMGID